MSKTTLLCGDLPNIPWQDKPAGCTAPLWRYSDNPVIRRNPLPGVARIFNSAVMPYEGAYIGVFRGEQTNGIPYIYLGRSADGIHWTFDPEKIPFVPFNRNAVLFPRKINGMYVMLSRPSDSGHTPFGDIFLSQSPDMEFWGRHRHVMSKSSNWWENVKIGGGAAPIETSEGWLLFYHGVTGTCNGYVYSIGGAILDRDDPSKVLYRCGTFLLTPEAEYEERGFVPNVCFPCATLQDAATGRIALYYGCADSYVGLAFTTADEVVDYIKAHDNAGLYQASRDPSVGQAMRRILEIYADKIYSPELHRQLVFFDKHYHSIIDLYSYGHDIESSWLIDWGCVLLGDAALSAKITAINSDLARSVYAHAYRDHSLLNECERGVDNTTRVWWVQAEAVLGFVNEYQKSGDPKYRDAAAGIWHYITEKILDKRPGGEWFWSVDANGVPASRQPIVEPWKCPYHNGRMCMELIRRDPHVEV